jgi:fatty acid synthase subunit beta
MSCPATTARSCVRKLATYIMLEGADAHVASMRRALAAWGLTTDDIGVLSIDRTCTGTNEKSETQIWQNIFETMSWTHGNAVPVITQKSLLGRSKGDSEAWPMAGLLQTVVTGIVSGTCNSE